MIVSACADSDTRSHTPITSMPLTVEAAHTLVNTLQTAADELNIQVSMPEGETYRRNSVVMYMRVLKENQDLDAWEEGGVDSLI